MSTILKYPERVMAFLLMTWLASLGFVRRFAAVVASAVTLLFVSATSATAAPITANCQGVEVIRKTSFETIIGAILGIAPYVAGVSIAVLVVCLIVLATTKHRTKILTFMFWVFGSLLLLSAYPAIVTLFGGSNC